MTDRPDRYVVELTRDERDLAIYAVDREAAFVNEDIEDGSADPADAELFDGLLSKLYNAEAVDAGGDAP